MDLLQSWLLAPAIGRCFGADEHTDVRDLGGPGQQMEGHARLKGPVLTLPHAYDLSLSPVGWESDADGVAHSPVQRVAQIFLFHPFVDQLVHLPRPDTGFDVGFGVL